MNTEPHNPKDEVDELDAEALNDAGWAFIHTWNSRIKQHIPGEVWNNIKPMVAEAIKTYLKKQHE